jgi:antitoxin (DNA-binding transcriptional repressor) of toxin-antitoxin stability system
MKKINFTEFRKSASHYIDLVERGETLQLLRHG